MKALTFLTAALAAASLFAAPGVPVCSEYVDWQGVIPKNYIAGRQIAASDLRHKVAVVLEIEPNEKLTEQLVAALPLARLTGLADLGSGGWENAKVPRDVIFVVVNRGERNIEAIKAALKAPADASEDVKAALKVIGGPTVPIYDAITFEKAPESDGKRPFVYVMSPNGKEPVFSAPFDDSAVSAVTAAVSEQKGAIQLWLPNLGSVPEPKFFPNVKAVVAKGAALKPLLNVLAKETQSKDLNRAREAQILYDALIQTRDDLTLKIALEAASAPHLAAADAQILFKAWPGQKKALAGTLAKALNVPGAQLLGSALARIMVYSRPDYAPKNAAEAKKAVAELTNLRKQLGKLKDAKTPAIQAGATAVEAKIDELLTSIPSRVGGK